jgi:hypothetical protein
MEGVSLFPSSRILGLGQVFFSRHKQGKKDGFVSTLGIQLE